MKILKILVATAFIFSGFFVDAQDKPKKMKSTETKQKAIQEDMITEEAPVMEQAKPQGPQKVAIEPSELPKEVHEEVLKNYYNGEITKAFKLMKEGKLTGYLAEVKNGPKTWTLEFDKTGNTLNKITPN